jgi:hypothetical protein
MLQVTDVLGSSTIGLDWHLAGFFASGALYMMRGSLKKRTYFPEELYLRAAV